MKLSEQIRNAKAWLKGNDSQPTAKTLDDWVRLAEKLEASALEAGCDLCDKWFPIEEGEHYGTQSLGMIPTTRCRIIMPRAEARAYFDAHGRCFIQTPITIGPEARIVGINVCAKDILFPR